MSTDVIPPELPTPAPPSPRFERRNLALAIAILTGLLSLAVILLPDLVLGGCWRIGYAICHQIRDRSLLFADLQLPLCARCTGTYLGVMLGITFIWLRGRQRSGAMAPVPILVALVGFIGIMGIDGLNSYLSLIPGLPYVYEPHNLLRVLTGSLNGLALSNIVWPVFGFTVWRNPTQVPPLKGWRELLVLLVVDLVVVFITFVEIPWLYYPIAIVTTLGTVIMLTIVNTMIVLIILKRESVAERWRELLVPALIGLALVGLELGLMNFFRSTMVQALGLPIL
ncbi:MAG: DUF2085 domain-containing protein [Chloroflexi bacterium]|nr:DUF2085 domain-containing protein [Chloroflexota bacterium]MBU1747069.1 DUF2085 domain-containing protein [Chloroflexota bacterium]